MEALVPALVAALLAQSSDRTPWLAAILADRFARPAILFPATVAALAAGNMLAALAGQAVAALLVPAARTLMLSLALLFAGVGALVPLRMPDRLDNWSIGAVATTFLGIAILAFGDAAQFVTFGIAARSAEAVPAALGATAGAAGALLVPMLLGEQQWRALPLTALRTTVAALFLTGAAILALQAFRII